LTRPPPTGGRGDGSTMNQASHMAVERTLLRYRLRVLSHRARALGAVGALQVAAVTALVGYLAVRWAWGRMDFSLADPGAFRESVRMEAYRLGAFMVAVGGLLDFGVLWRNRDIEVLNLFPVPAQALFRFRSLEMAAWNFPLLALGLTTAAALGWHGHWYEALEVAVFLGALFVETLVWSLYWHAFAGSSVGTPSFEWVKEHLAGAMVLKDRTLLLYSPFLVATSSFLSGLLILIGMSAMARNRWAVGGALVLAVIPPTIWALRQGALLMERGYYRALAALAEGEQLGEMGESAPPAEFFGQWYASRMPHPVRPLVIKDLRQAWRRNRLDHLVLGTGTIALMILGGRNTQEALGAGWGWPAWWVLMGFAAGQAFRMTRPGSDAPWHWLSLPVSMERHLVGRLMATSFFVGMVAPGAVLSLHWMGLGWADALARVVPLAVGTAVLATHLAVTMFQGGPHGWILFGALLAASYLLGEGVRAQLVWLAVFAAATLLLLPRLPARLARAEQGEDGGRR